MNLIHYAMILDSTARIQTFLFGIAPSLPLAKQLWYDKEMKSQKVVKLCKNSTITEAWFVVGGVPAKIENDELGAINVSAQKTVKGLKTVPTIVLAPQTNEPQLPFWTTQFSYKSDQRQARVGHNYLSVHTISNPQNQYSGYSSALKPDIEEWLKVVSSALKSKEKFKINTISFGYINTFEFPAKAFDISEYFQINLGVQLEGVGSISNLQTSFRFFDSEKNLYTNLLFEIFPSPQNAKVIIVRIQTITEEVEISNVDIGQISKILEKTAVLKDKSKNSFFGFSTEKTKTLMGVTYE